jgi:hypothetical protein
MNPKATLTVFSAFAYLVASPAAFADTNSLNPDGLYYIASGESAPTVAGDDGTVVHLGPQAETLILKSHVYSENNANTDFEVRLDTSNYATDPKTGSPVKSFILRIGDRGYAWAGGGGTSGNHNLMWFKIHNRPEAEKAAKSLSVECGLRNPPGCKFSVQFDPTQPVFYTNGPVKVKFEIKNLDDRAFAFQHGGQQRGYRDNQFGFRAMLFDKPVADTGNPMNFGGLCGLVNLGPGQVFDDQVDLKKWFNFDKTGTYRIHGFYLLDFYQPDKTDGSFMPWNLLWSDYASADFTVVVQ